MIVVIKFQYIQGIKYIQSVLRIRDILLRIRIQSFFAFYFWKLHLYHFSEIKSHKKSQNSRTQSTSYYFCLMIEGSESVPLTDGSRSGSGRLKNTGSATLHKTKGGLLINSDALPLSIQCLHAFFKWINKCPKI